MCILFLLQNYKAKRKGGEEEYNYSWIFKTILWLIIIPASVALPNRYIPISNTRIHTGKVVDKTRSKMPTKTTGGWQNYVKIKIDGENTYFWYNLWNETKNDGAKCILLWEKRHLGPALCNECGLHRGISTIIYIDRPSWWYLSSQRSKIYKITTKIIWETLLLF